MAEVAGDPSVKHLGGDMGPPPINSFDIKVLYNDFNLNIGGQKK